MDFADLSRIAIDSLMITFVSLWVSGSAGLGTLKKAFFFGIYIISSLFLITDISIILITRFNLFVIAKLPLLIERMYLVKIAVLLNLAGIFILFFAWAVPVDSTEKAARLTMDGLRFLGKTVNFFWEFIKRIKRSITR